MRNSPDAQSAKPGETLIDARHIQQKLMAYAGFCLGICMFVFFLIYYLDVAWQEFLKNFPAMKQTTRATLFFVPAWSAGALAVLSARSWPRYNLAVIDLIFSIVLLAGLGLLVAVLFPAQGFLYPYIGLLLLHALFAPYFPWIQGLLSAGSLLMFLSGEIFAFRFLSETQRILLREGGIDSFWKQMVIATAFLALLAYLLLKASQALARNIGPTAVQGHLDNYVIQKFLGTGGMGKVYLATHKSICRPTALKILEPKAEDFPTALARFEREVRLCSTLSHPNTVTIFDYGKSGDSIFYYAMESLQGLDLQKWVERFGPMPVYRLVHILKQVCASLDEAHQKGIIHRDIKPSNIFLAKLGGLYDFVKVLDFGLAKEMKAEQNLTEPNVFLGTPAYVAPEMILDRKHVDARTDIYMLGCVAFWALTGHPPFSGENDAQVILEHVRTLPAWPSEAGAGEIPMELDRLIMRCMEKRMEDRFSKISEVAAALDAVPLKNPWTQAEARQWWAQNVPETSLEPSSQTAVVLAEELQEAASAGHS